MLQLRFDGGQFLGRVAQAFQILPQAVAGGLGGLLGGAGGVGLAAGAGLQPVVLFQPQDFAQHFLALAGGAVGEFAGPPLHQQRRIDESFVVHSHGLGDELLRFAHHIAGQRAGGGGVQQRQFEDGVAPPAAQAGDAVALVAGGEFQLDATFVGAGGDYVVLQAAPGLAPERPGDAVQQRRFAVAVGAAEAGDVQAGEVQRRRLAVRQEIVEGEFEGYHSGGWILAVNPALL